MKVKNFPSEIALALVTAVVESREMVAQALLNCARLNNSGRLALHLLCYKPELSHG